MLPGVSIFQTGCHGAPIFNISSPDVSEFLEKLQVLSMPKTVCGRVLILKGFLKRLQSYKEVLGKHLGSIQTLKGFKYIVEIFERSKIISMMLQYSKGVLMMGKYCKVIIAVSQSSKE